MRSRDLGLLLLLLAFAAGKSSRAARSPSSPSSPPAPKPEAPDYNMSPEEQAERLPISTDDWIEVQRGKSYRMAGDVESASPVDTQALKRKMEFFGARDVKIGERPPHRATWNMGPSPIEFRVRRGAPLPFDLGGLTLRLQSAQPIAGSGVVVGKRKGSA